MRGKMRQNNIQGGCNQGVLKSEVEGREELVIIDGNQVEQTRGILGALERGVDLAQVLTTDQISRSSLLHLVQHKEARTATSVLLKVFNAVLGVLGCLDYNVIQRGTGGADGHIVLAIDFAQIAQAAEDSDGL